MVVFQKIGWFFKLIFIHLFNLINFILDNTIGLIFNKAFSRYQRKFEKDTFWYQVKSVILIGLLLYLIFSFKNIYDFTLGKLLGKLLINIGNLIGDNLYGKILSNFGNNFASGIGVTLYLALIGTTVGFIIAIFFSLIVTMKVNPGDNKFLIVIKKIGRGFVKVYVTVLRGTPMMVQAMIVYWGSKSIVKWDYLTAALVVVSINTAAYLTEVLRGGIGSIDSGQHEAGLSLGLTNFQTMMFIVFPQAIKNSMAAIGNEFVINVKDTSVLSIILVVDLFRVASLAQGRYAAGFEPYIIVAVIYLILTLSITQILKKVSKVLDVPVVELPSAN